MIWSSLALVGLLASTWLIVGASLHNASTAIVSAGRTGFTVVGLLGLTVWSTSREPTTSREVGVADAHQISVRPYRWWNVLMLALMGVTAYTVLSTAAISFAGPVLPTLIVSLTPAVVLAADSLLNRRRPPTVTIIGTALAVAGAILYVAPKLAGTLGHNVLLGTLFAAAAMLSMAFYGLYFARVNRGYHGAMAPRILPIFAVGTIPLAIWAIADLSEGARASWSSVAMLAFLGIVIYVPAYLLQHRILLTAGPSYSAILGLAVPPVVGAATALLHLAGAPTVVQVLGMALTLCGMAIVVRRTLQPLPDRQKRERQV